MSKAKTKIGWFDGEQQLAETVGRLVPHKYETALIAGKTYTIVDVIWHVDCWPDLVVIRVVRDPLDWGA